MTLKEWLEEDSRVLTELETLLFRANVHIGNMKDLRTFVDTCSAINSKIKIKEDVADGL